MPTKLTKPVVRTLDLTHEGKTVTVKLDDTGVSIRLGRNRWGSAKTLEWKTIMAALFKPSEPTE